jgi:DNA (cytosine-5)-methyltransferase 1
MNTENRFTFIDLFSGIGGFRIALNNIGGKCMNFSEINADAVNAYCDNFREGSDSNLGDITGIKGLPEHDILTAGVPCQSWSIAGKNLGFDDDRGQLWNDTIYLLNQSKPKAFIFENVKGLADPRNKDALDYILTRIKEAGYFANYYILNSFDYGVPQNRVRIYIVGFREKKYYSEFNIPMSSTHKIRLGDILSGCQSRPVKKEQIVQQSLFGDPPRKKYTSLSSSNGVNDYFLFNDLRNGHSTIHSWDIIETTERQKDICYLLLRNRRKSSYGKLDGNPLSLEHFKELDSTITLKELSELVNIDILKAEQYSFLVEDVDCDILSGDEQAVLSHSNKKHLIVDDLKSSSTLKLKRISIAKTLEGLLQKSAITCEQIRYDFKNTKISTGLFGVNRIFLPTSDIFPTLVASDSNDYVTLEMIDSDQQEDYRKEFIEKVYKKNKYRKITKEEACLMQGFPQDFRLPESRVRWMKLLGNSVSVPVVQMLGKAILDTGIFNPQEQSSLLGEDVSQVNVLSAVSGSVSQ